MEAALLRPLFYAARFDERIAVLSYNGFQSLDAAGDRCIGPAICRVLFVSSQSLRFQLSGNPLPAFGDRPFVPATLVFGAVGVRACTREVQCAAIERQCDVVVGAGEVGGIGGDSYDADVGGAGSAEGRGGATGDDAASARS